MATVRRYDAASFGKAVRRENGTLTAPATLTRIGVFAYQRADGTTRFELRPPEEVFKEDSLSSFGLVPVTEDLGGLGKGHPREGHVTLANLKRVQVGAVGENIRQDGDHVVGNLLITDPDTIKRMDAGKVFVSCGYSADCEETPGVWRGQRYDAIQRNIRGDHVAIVDAARGGPSCRVRLDGADAVQVDNETAADAAQKEGKNMRKFVIDGIEFEVSEPAAQAFEKAQKASTAEIATLKTDAEKATARADAAERKLAETEKARADAADPKRFEAAVASRVELLSKSREVLGSEFKTDGLDDRGLRLAVIAKLDPEFKADGKSDDAVSATFDAALKFRTARAPAVVRVDAGPADGQIVDRRAAFQAAAEKACEGGKK